MSPKTIGKACSLLLMEISYLYSMKLNLGGGPAAVLDRYGLRPLWDVFLFAAITVVFHVLWRLGRDWIEASSLFISLSDAATHMVYLSAAWVNEKILGLDMLRLDAVCTFRFLDGGLPPDGRIAGTMIVDHTCSGLKQFYQAFFLFLLYPGPWRHKLWFIPLAILVMHLVNVFRVVALSLVMVHAYPHWDLMHDWVLRPFFYVVLFALWVVWNERFRARAASVNQTSNNGV
jgi:exosortase/archaeosortase family protein